MTLVRCIEMARYERSQMPSQFIAHESGRAADTRQVPDRYPGRSSPPDTTPYVRPVIPEDCMKTPLPTHRDANMSLPAPRSRDDARATPDQGCKPEGRSRTTAATTVASAIKLGLGPEHIVEGPPTRYSECPVKRGETLASWSNP